MDLRLCAVVWWGDGGDQSGKVARVAWVNGGERAGRSAAESTTNGSFFFQAEDGIRDIGVTGVQTCALPISRRRTAASARWSRTAAGTARRPGAPPAPRTPGSAPAGSSRCAQARTDPRTRSGGRGSEERRVGQECRTRWSPYRLKKILSNELL